MNTSAPLVGGRYEVHEEIGVGGMATVHLGRRVEGDGARVVAIKRLHPHLAKDPEIATMFLDEARLASRIDHPNVVRIVDVVASGTDVSLVMDHVLGFSLDRVLTNAKQRTPAPVALRVAHDALLGLQAAHAASDEQGAPLRLVHRDVSPHNLLVGADGATRVLDFGVAKADGRLQQRTRTNETKGKVAYMSPEQVLCENVDARTDVHALGVCLWEMLAGTRAHVGPEPAIMRAILERGLSPLATVDPSLAPLDGLIARATAKDRAERFRSAEEMLEAITSVGIGLAGREVVAAWLREQLREKLEERAALVEVLEAMGSSNAPAPAAPEVPRAEGLAAVVASIPSQAPSHAVAAPSRLPYVLGLAVAALVVAGWFLGPWSAAPSTVEANAAEPNPVERAPLATSTPTAAASSASPVETVEPSASAAASSAAAVKPLAPASPAPSARPRATTSPAPSGKRRETLF